MGLLLTLGWGLAGIAGSLAGLLAAPTSAFGPYYMDLIFVYAFTAAVIGGLESPVGALLGGLISGLCISYVGGYLGSGLEPLGALAEMVRVTAKGGLVFVRDLARPDNDVEVDRLVELYGGEAPAAAEKRAAYDHQRFLFRASLKAALTVREVADLASRIGLPPDVVHMTSDRHWTLAYRKP